MDDCIKSIFSRVIKISAGFALLGSLAACSTTSSVNAGNSAAPITYKVGQHHSARYASLNPRSMPRASSGYRQASPRSTHTAPRTPYIPPPATVVPSAPSQSQPIIEDSFDTASIDRTLRSHQILGKKYRFKGKSYTPKHEPDYNIIGTASWYGDKFHGKPTASGEKFNKNDLTAAHKTLPLNSLLRVTNLETGKAIMVRLNDRGPFVGDRLIDLSEAAALELGTYSNDLAIVRVQYAGPADAAYGTPSSPLAPQPVEPPTMSAEAPQYTAPTPKYTPAEPAPAPSYAPLRAPSEGDMEVLTTPTPMPYIPPVDSTPMAPAAPDYELGKPEENNVDGNFGAEAYVQPERNDLSDYDPEVDGGTVTLTIKGPIHMATHKNEVPKPRIIPARYETVTRNKR